jgi:hypothetical protein
MIPSELFAIADNNAQLEIGQSLRFRSASSTYLKRQTTIAGNKQKWSWSGWIKRGNLITDQMLFATNYYVVNVLQTDQNIGFSASGAFYIYQYNSATGHNCNVVTTQVFRDPSAWYHFLVIWDTTNAISSERVKIYVNGNRITSFTTATYPAQNSNSYYNDNAYPISNPSITVGSYINNATSATGYYFDGYMAEVNFVDGQALLPTSFGKFSAETGQWVPIEYTGTYGTNGFHLDFSDASSVTTLGYDKSGNNNNWTPVNISLTAGDNYDSMLDSPTNNFAALNPIFESASGLSNGNLSVASSSGNFATTPIPESGKWYFEITVVSVSGLVLGSSAEFGFGWRTTNDLVSGEGLRIVRYYSVGGVTSYYSVFNGVQETNTSLYALGAGTVLQFAIDCNAGTVDFYSNGIFRKTFTGMTRSRDLFPTIQRGASSFTLSAAINFGQRPFAYTPPTGFQKLCSKNLPEPSIKRGETGMDIATYTGNGGNIQIGEYQFPRPNYLIGRSLRLKGVSQNFLRTPSTNSNYTTWTWSGWIKRSSIGVIQTLFCAGTGMENNTAAVEIDAADNLVFSQTISGNRVTYRKSSLILKDTTNWVHVVVASDTTNATTQNRLRLFVGGNEITSWVTNTTVAQNATWHFNNNTLHVLGAYFGGGFSQYFNGYLSEVNFIDGQALTPTSFGEQDINGYWIPKAYTGTYGTNGFYLPFSDNTALTTSSNVGLGKDFSGNGNYWQTVGISLTAGTTYDSMIDSPTQNYATFDALRLSASGSTTTLSEGGLRVANGSSSFGNVAISNLQILSGKWYTEVTVLSIVSNTAGEIGIIGANTPFNITSAGGVGNCYVGTEPTGYAANTVQSVSSFNKRHNNISQTYGTSAWVANDVISILYDADNRTLEFWRNGTSLGIAYNNIQPGPYVFASSAAGWVWSWNFGQRPFTYTPPTGYNTVSIPNITEYTYDLESPDLVWIKSRNAATNHMLFDSVRGVNRYISSNLTTADTTDVNSLVSFNKNGFYLGNNSAVNTLNNTYVSWMWKAGTSTITNTAGVIISQVRANPSLGFSVVSYTGTGANTTVGHGLGVAPKMMIVRNISSGTANTGVYHASLGDTYFTLLNSTAAAGQESGWWGNVTPTSTVFTVGGGFANVNAASYIAYCFSDINGYSSFGKYTGNGSADGPFVYCGFKPRWIMVKRTDSTGNWQIWDTFRGSYNTINTRLAADVIDGEGTNLAAFDLVSNGFKLRDTNANWNTTNGTYIYAAFAEVPFKYSTAR